MRTSFSAIIATLAMLAGLGSVSAKPAPSSRDPLYVDCIQPQDCPTIQVPRWSAADGRLYRCVDVIDDHGLEITPIQLAFLCDQSSGRCPNLENGAVWLICPASDGSDRYYDPRDYRIKHPEDIARKLPASCRSYLKVGLNHRNLARGVAAGITIPKNLSPCQQGEAACNNYVSALERERDTLVANAQANCQQSGGIYNKEKHACVGAITAFPYSRVADQVSGAMAQAFADLQACQAKGAGYVFDPASNTCLAKAQIIGAVTTSPAGGKGSANQDVRVLLIAFTFAVSALLWLIVQFFFMGWRVSKMRAYIARVHDGFNGCLTAYERDPDPELIARMGGMPVAVLTLFTRLIKSRRATGAESAESLEDAEHRLANPVYVYDVPAPPLSDASETDASASELPSSEDVDRAINSIIVDDRPAAPPSPPGRLDDNSAWRLSIEALLVDLRDAFKGDLDTIDRHLFLPSNAKAREKRETKNAAREASQRLRAAEQRLKEFKFPAPN